MSHGMEYLDLGSTDPRIVAVRIDGTMTAAAMEEFLLRLEAIRAADQKAIVYVDATGYVGFELGVARAKLRHLGTLWSHIERMAYVVDKKWMETWVGLADAVTPMHIRAFAPEQDAEARAWILSDD